VGKKLLSKSLHLIVLHFRPNNEYTFAQAALGVEMDEIPPGGQNNDYQILEEEVYIIHGAH